MEKYVKKYHLKDPQQYEDEREYWRGKTPEERLMALEAVRKTWHKLNPKEDGNEQGLLPQGIPSEEELFELLTRNEVKYLLDQDKLDVRG